MDIKTASAVLLKAFGALNAKQKGNIRYHLKKGTRVLCGRQSYLYTDEAGGG